MTTRTREVLQLALQLEPNELAELMRLLNALDASREDDSEQPEGWNPAWVEELDRRNQDGPEHWTEGAEVLKQIFEEPS